MASPFSSSQLVTLTYSSIGIAIDLLEQGNSDACLSILKNVHQAAERYHGVRNYDDQQD